MFNFKYDDPYYPDNGNYRQVSASTIITPTGKALMGNNKYLDKLFKESGYKGLRPVINVYELVGDEEGQLSPINFEGVILASDSDEFIYLKRLEAFENLKKIIRLINDQKGFFIGGDSSDYTSFSVMIRNQIRDVIIEFNLISEKLWIYQGLVAEDNTVHPVVLLSYNLGEEHTFAKVEEIVNSKEAILDTPPRFNESITVAELRELLVSVGVIKYSKKSKQYLPCEGFEDSEMISHCIEEINSVSYGRSFTTVHGASSEVIEVLESMYESSVIDHKIFEESSIAIFSPARFIWNYSKWKSIE